MDITRRWFVFGSVAAVAAATLPIGPSIERVTAAHVFLKRKIIELSVSFIVENNVDEAALIEVLKDGHKILHFPMNVQAMLRWIAVPGDEIYLLPLQTFDLIATAKSAIGKIDMMCYDWIDNGPPVAVVERYLFPQNEDLQKQLYFIHTDNSLEARLARGYSDIME